MVGLFAAFCIGILLGIFGAGGSMLAVPVLVYFLHVEPVLATSYSLFVVGFSALLGTWLYYKKGHVDLPTALAFAAPSILAVFIARKYILPIIPHSIIDTPWLHLSKDTCILVCFALLMFTSAIFMLRSKNRNPEKRTSLPIQTTYLLLAFEGLFIGLITGLLGAGGGFLIVPALVLLAGLDMKAAIGTSLFIIATKSLIGVLGDLGNLPIDFRFVTFFTLPVLVGMVSGVYFSGRMNASFLKPAFGWFVLLVSVCMLGKEIQLVYYR